jgi:hypothetical protein
MIDQIDDKLCEDFDNGVSGADRQLLIHLTNQVRVLIDTVNTLINAVEEMSDELSKQKAIIHGKRKK